MLKFFYRSWTELADDKPSWLVSEEEVQVHSLLKECLAFTGGILPNELSNLAVKWLRADETAREAASYDLVLVDDYQLLSRASQVLARLLAREGLVVTGDMQATSEVFEEYPYAAGLIEFAQADGVQKTRLDACWNSAAVHACCENLIGAAQTHEQESRDLAGAGGNGEREAMPSEAAWNAATAAGTSVFATCADTAPAKNPAGCADACAFPAAEAEIAHVAQHIADAIEKGTQPSDFYLAAPNGVWAKSLGRSLEARGISTAQRPSARMLSGDSRDLGRCKTSRLVTLLALAADPCDMLAWRSWCGFGDWLTNNPGFAALRRYAAQQGLAPYDALATVAADNPCREALGELDAAEQASLERISQAFKTGQAALMQLEGLVGRQLIDAAWELLGCEQHAQETTAGQGGVPADLLRLLDVENPKLAHDAASLVGRLLMALNEPRFPLAQNAVRIGDLAASHGSSYRTVVLSGFVNGFIPKHAYFDPVKTPLDRMGLLYGTDARRVYQAAGCAREELLVTAFTQMDALQAERLDLKVDRVFMREGKRLARISPSELIGSMGLEMQEAQA